MSDDTDINTLRRILIENKRVAMVGLSADWSRPSNFAAKYLLEHGFEVYPVNPKSPEIMDRKAYTMVSEIPGDVDLVNISIKNTFVPMAIEDCGKKGVKFAIIHTAGFKEVGEEGLKLQNEVVEIAHRYGMRVYEPNSQGIQNSDPGVKAYANFTFTPMIGGNISILAQSGGVGEYFL